MPIYAPFPGEQTLVPPGTFEDTRFFFFFLHAERERTQALCDRTFNERAGNDGVHYRAFGTVMLAFTHVERLLSPSTDEGWITYKDIALWVPVWGGSERTGKHLCLFPPFIFVDDVATMITGREIFGLPKQFGRFTMPSSLDDLARAHAPQFTADVMGTRQPREAREWQRLIEVRQSSPPKEDLSAVIAGPLDFITRKAATKIAEYELGGIGVPAGLGTLRALGLKQFRDVTDPAQACYQAIVEAPLTTLKVHKVRPLFGDFEVTLHDVASHPVARELGLVSGPQSVWFTIYLNATMMMGAGQEVWRGHGEGT